MNVDYNLEQVSSIAKQVIKKASSKKLLFYGEMGAGKTTLIKEICRQLGCLDTVTSPSFSLVNEYTTSLKTIIYHFDFYRIIKEDEAFDIGIEDYFDSNSWCLVEWPENIENLLPLDSTIINIKILNNGMRNIQLKQTA